MLLDDARPARALQPAPAASLRRGAQGHAVDGISFQVRRGSAFGIVGESGCGKSTTALALMQLIQSTGGHATLDCIDLLGARGQAQAEMRRRVQMIFQDPYSSLDPRQRVEASSPSRCAS
ncbi:ATP-binding cassette domain-containing protein [Cupriavidus basilensis]